MKILHVALALTISATAQGSDEHEKKPADAPAHDAKQAGHGEAKKEDHGAKKDAGGKKDSAKKDGGKKDAKKDDKGAAHGDGHATAEAQIDIGGYIHNWVKFPELNGVDLASGEPTHISIKKDTAMVVFFIASYDIGSQNLIDKFKAVEARYSPRFTKFIYAFVNDLEKEAVAFLREHNVKGTAVLIDQDTKQAFQHPPLNLPMIYVGDRKGWLTMRFGSVDKSAVAKVDEFLDLVNAI